MSSLSNGVSCTVKVSSSQLVCGQRESSSFETEGIWAGADGELEFNDIIKNDNGEALKAKLVIKDKHILVYRDGRLQFDFDCGRATSTLYQTPVGELPMSIVTRDIKARTDDGGGRVTIEYTLVFEPDTEIVCVYDIEIVAKASIIC